MIELKAEEARRIALAAQGFGAPSGRADRRGVRRLLGRIAALQIDAVSVLVRSQYLPVYSRLGPYDQALIDRMTHEHRDLFECRAHQSSLAPVALHPLLRPFMALAAQQPVWPALAEVLRDRPRWLEEVYDEFALRGPLRAADLGDRTKGEGFGDWGPGKLALEWLIRAGRVAVAGRRGAERVYDLTERVLPPGILAMPTPSPDEARKELIVVAARALGVATAGDLLDYFRMRPGGGRAAIRELVDEGRLEPARVHDWREPAYVLPSTKVPAAIEARAVLTPFDSLIWYRPRTERLFGFRYRIEIYVPAARRRYGYYVLPFILGDRLVARIDLKADRRGGTLLVRAAHLESGENERRVASELGAELRRLAGWLGLERVEVTERGDLAGHLAELFRSSTP